MRASSTTSQLTTKLTWFCNIFEKMLHTKGKYHTVFLSLHDMVDSLE